jgi:signal transduction histidine kinase
MLFLIAITLIDGILITLYCHQQYLKTENVYSEMAEIVSEMAARNLKLTYFINSAGNENQESLNGRVLVLNLKKTVIADSLKQFEGKVIENPEIRKTYSTKKTSVGYYKMGSERIAMLSYPMFKKNIFTGSILISYSVADVWKDNLKFSCQVAVISAAVILIIMVITFYMGRRFANPIKKMTDASLQILNGKSGVTVDINEIDEIGTLARTFNQMSTELNRIEVGRKRFISSISHEFKTPLTSIKALIEPFIGEEQVDTELLNQHLCYVNMEIDRLSKLVRSLVTATRLEEIKPSITRINTFEEVNTVVRILTPIASERGMTVSNNISENINIESDRDLFREIVINLVDNAIKYGKAGGWVRISSEEMDDRITVTIIDNGKGIKNKDLPYIFDNFYMSDDAREGGKGSGIGLYVVKRIIEILGWDIYVESTEGKGTGFKMHIPKEHR